MHRSVVAPALAVVVMVLPALARTAEAVDPASEAVSAPTMCGGKRVTIDLDARHHANPDRAASDVVLGTEDDDRIRTGRGDDVVCGGPGRDHIALGPGDDAGYGQKSSDVLSGGAGRDLLDGGERVDAVSYADAPRAVKVDLRITGPQDTGWGRDTIVGRSVVLGSPYADVLHSPETRVLVVGGAGDDRLVGGQANDRQTGGAGDDLIMGGGANDSIIGGPGDDTMLGGAGHDVFETFESPAPGDDVAEGGADGDLFDSSSNGDHYDGGDGNDWFEGSCSPCDERLIELVGGAGEDTFRLTQANERVDGGDGVDIVRYESFRDQGPSLTIDLEIVGPQDTGAGGTDDFRGIENINGVYGFPNYLSGDEGDNVLYGGAADDVLIGRGGDDSLAGGDGTDTCDGGTGNNVVGGCEL